MLLFEKDRFFHGIVVPFVDIEYESCLLDVFSSPVNDEVGFGCFWNPFDTNNDIHSSFLSTKSLMLNNPRKRLLFCWLRFEDRSTTASLEV